MTNKIGMQTSRKTKALKTRKALIEAASALFSEKSYEDVYIEEITSRAGTAKGTFYLYFESKAHIILELFKNIDTYYDIVRKNLGVYPTASEKLLFFTKKQQWYISHKLGLDLTTVIYVHQLHTADFPVFLADERRLLYSIINDLVSEGQQKQEFRTDKSARELTAWITFAMRSIIFDWCIHKGKYDLVKKGQEIFGEFIKCIIKDINTC